MVDTKTVIECTIFSVNAVGVNQHSLSAGSELDFNSGLCAGFHCEDFCLGVEAGGRGDGVADLLTKAMDFI